jgi:hypothetical protein
VWSSGGPSARLQPFRELHPLPAVLELLATQVTPWNEGEGPYAGMPGPEGGVVGDIETTHATDPAVRAVRIIRSPVSYNERPFLPGKFGEEILANSAD